VEAPPKLKVQKSTASGVSKQGNRVASLVCCFYVNMLITSKVVWTPNYLFHHLKESCGNKRR